MEVVHQKFNFPSLNTKTQRHKGVTAFLCAFVSLCLMTDAQAQPIRIVSTTLTTDEIVASLVDPSRIAALSRFSADPEGSNVADTAKRINRFIERDAEQIVRLNPDMVLFTHFSKVDLKRVIQQAAIPHLELTQFETTADIESNIRAAGRALGEEKRADDLIRELKRKLDEARQQVRAPRRAWRVLYLAAGDWTAGHKTTMNELIRHAGLRNAAAEAGISGNTKISLENILRIDPEVVLIGTGYERDRDFERFLTTDSRFAFLQAVRKKRIVSLPSRYVTTTSHFIGDGALSLSRRISALPE